MSCGSKQANIVLHLQCLQDIVKHLVQFLNKKPTWAGGFRAVCSILPAIELQLGVGGRILGYESNLM